jgi:hypothetical protein
MEAVIISETSVNFYQTTGRNIPEDWEKSRATNEGRIISGGRKSIILSSSQALPARPG